MQREMLIVGSLLTLALSSPLLAAAAPPPPEDLCVGGIDEGCGPTPAGPEGYALGACRTAAYVRNSLHAVSPAPSDGAPQAGPKALTDCRWDGGVSVPWLGGTEVPGPVREVPRVIGEVMSRHGHLGGLVAEPCPQFPTIFEPGEVPCPPKPYSPPGPTAGYSGCDRFSAVCAYPDHMGVLPANGSHSWCRTGKDAILAPTHWTATGISAGRQFVAEWSMSVPQYGGQPDAWVRGSAVFYYTTEPGVYQTLEPFPPAGAFTLGTTFPDCRLLYLNSPALAGGVGVWRVYGQ